MKVKLFFNSCLMIFVSSYVFSCVNNSNPKTREEQIESFRNELTSKDTMSMLSICDAAMEQLKAKNFDQVLNHLYEYNDSTKEVNPLSESTRHRYERIFKLFPVQSYKREYFSFMLEGCNDVKYQVIFATAEQTGQAHDAITMYMFNPVRVNGEWVLCVKGAENEFDIEKQ